MNIFIIVYLIAVNLFGFGIMLYDKKQAKASQRRVPEKRLFLIAALGGALGSIIGMQVARHKTKHWNFLVGMPLIFITNLLIFYPMAVFGINNWITYVIHLIAA